MAMKCPSCNTTFGTPAAQCPQCRLTLRRLDIKFGALPRRSRYFTDRTGRLHLSAIREMRGMLRLFMRKFPQCHLSVLIVDRVINGTIGEYVFWLANRGRYSSLESVGAENFDLLLGIDAEAGAAALVVGYGLENYLSEQDLRDALTEAGGPFQAGDFPGGIRHCVEFMTNRMRDIAKDIEGRGATRNVPAGETEW
jgi:uncharacterized membrane protein YgcG